MALLLQDCEFQKTQWKKLKYQEKQRADSGIACVRALPHIPAVSAGDMGYSRPSQNRSHRGNIRRCGRGVCASHGTVRDGTRTIVSTLNLPKSVPRPIHTPGHCPCSNAVCAARKFYGSRGVLHLVSRQALAAGSRNGGEKIFAETAMAREGTRGGLRHLQQRTIHLDEHPNLQGIQDNTDDGNSATDR